MQQKRLYYNNSYLKKFDALVAAVYTDADKLCVILDNTAFYPSSGGQPCDFGVINGVFVSEVLEREDGEIVHIIPKDSPLKEGLEVKCSIDWDRRFDHMQQHTGQHILSGAFAEKFSLQTESFHLGRDFSTIDLSVSHLAPEKIMEAESLANKIVFENRSVGINYLTGEEAREKLRKDSCRSGNLRVIDVKDFDLSACGGTHCSNTGEVGTILIKGWEKIKSNLRLEFYCGFRGLKLFREYNSIFRDISARFSTGPGDLVSRMDKLVSENKNNFKKLKDLKEKLLEQEIEFIYKSSDCINDIRYIKYFSEDKPVKELKILGQKVTEKFPSVLMCLAAAGETWSLILIRSDDLNINITEIMRGMERDFSGKGGGRPDFFQGGGYSREDINKIFLIFKEKIKYNA